MSRTFITTFKINLCIQLLKMLRNNHSQYIKLYSEMTESDNETVLLWFHIIYFVIINTLFHAILYIYSTVGELQI